MFCGASASTAGNRLGDLNQDYCLVVDENDSMPIEDGCWAVFDGHGLLGEHASRIAASTVELLITESDSHSEGQSVEDEMKSAYLYAHQNICASYNIAPKMCRYGKFGSYRLNVTEEKAFYLSEENPEDQRPVEYGTAALTAWKKGPKLYIAWCGNSQAVIGGLTREGDPTSLETEFLTKPHIVENAKERRRLIQESQKNPTVTVSEKGVMVGETLLDITRALGHPDILSTPQVISLELEEKHQVLLLGTASVWKYLQHEDAVKIALQNEDAQSAAEAIIAAVVAVNPNKEDQDNASVVVVYFDME